MLGEHPEFGPNMHPAEICRGGSSCDCQHGTPGSTLTGQQRNDLAVYGTVFPDLTAPSVPASSNGTTLLGIKNDTGTD